MMARQKEKHPIWRCQEEENKKKEYRKMENFPFFQALKLCIYFNHSTLVNHNILDLNTCFSLKLSTEKKAQF